MIFVDVFFSYTSGHENISSTFHVTLINNQLTINKDFINICAFNTTRGRSTGVTMTYATCLTKTFVLINFTKKIWMQLYFSRWPPQKMSNVWLQISWLNNRLWLLHVFTSIASFVYCISYEKYLVQIQSIYVHSLISLWFIAIIYCQYCNVIHIHSFVLYWDVVYVHISVHSSVVLCNTLFWHDMWGEVGVTCFLWLAF